MTDDSNVDQAGGQGGLSRRAALKAGVATGVGVAVWSGVSITSLGGTPAYALGCTGARTFQLNKCDSADSRSGTQFAYQGMQDTGSTDFFLQNKLPQTGTDCEDVIAANVQFVFPSTYECRLVVRFFNGGKDVCKSFPDKGVTYTHYLPTDGDPTAFDQVSPLNVALTCYEADIGGNNWFYSIEVDCRTKGSPKDCFPAV